MSKKRARTSLETQLNKLHAPQTDTARTGTKIRTSFLYTSIAAAGIDTNTHYSNTRAAFQSMLKIDDGIKIYEELLFGESSKSFERSALSAEEASGLDLAIRRFLVDFLTPHFSLNSMHKLLEWLVFKFDLVSYNWQDLLAATIPYHETLLFVRVVQMCGTQIAKESSDNIWRFLSPLIRAGTPLIRQVIITHCISSRNFANLLADKLSFTLEDAGHSSVYLNFYVSVLFGIMHHDDFVKNEESATLIFGAIQAGLNSTHWPHTLSIYALIGFFFSRTTLDDKLVERIIRRMSKSLKKRTYEATSEEEIISRFWQTISIMAAHQDLGTLPSTALELLPETLTQQMTNSTALMLIIVNSLLATRNEANNWTKLDFILDQSKLGPPVVASLIDGLVNIVVCEQNTMSKKDKKLISMAITTLERKYPSVFDGVLSHQREKLALLRPFIKSIKFSVAADDEDAGGISMMDGVVHASLPIRIASYEKLMADIGSTLAKNKYASLTDSPLDCDFLKSALTRALDDEPQVATLLFPIASSSHLSDLISESQLRNQLMKLLLRCQQNKNSPDDAEQVADETWSQLERLVLVELLEMQWPNQIDFLLLLIPYLIPSSPQEMDLIKQVVSNESGLVSWDSIEFIRKFYKKTLNKSSGCDLIQLVDKFATLIAERYTSSAKKNEDDLLLLEFFVSMESQLPVKCAIFALLCLHKVTLTVTVDDNEKYNHCGLMYVTLLKSLLNSPLLKKSKHRKSMELADLSVWNMALNAPTLALLFRHFGTLISKVHLPRQEPSDLWQLHAALLDANEIHFLTPLFDLIHHGAQETEHKRVKAAFNELLDSLAKLDPTLLAVWTAAYLPCYGNSVRQANALSLLQKMDASVIKLSTAELIGTSLCLVSSEQHIRRAALDLLKKIKTTDAMTPLVKLILKNETKIINSADRISLIASVWVEKLVKEEDHSGATEWLTAMLEQLLDANLDLSTKLGLLKIMSSTDSEIVVHLEPLFEELVVNEKDRKVEQSSVEYQCASVLVGHVVSCLEGCSAETEDEPERESDSSARAVQLYLTGLKSPFISSLIFDLTTVQWFDSIRVEHIKTEILDGFLSLAEAAETSQVDRYEKMMKTLKQIAYDGKIMSGTIERLVANNASGSISTKRPKVALDTRSVSRLFVLLDAAQESPTQLAHPSLLVKSLVRLLDFFSPSSENADLLSDFNRHIILKLINRSIGEDAASVLAVNQTSLIEPVMATLRSSHSREVKQQAISVLSAITCHIGSDDRDVSRAKLLACIADILTYLADSIRRANDEMTMKTIGDILDAILAPLIEKEPTLHDRLIALFLNELPKIPVHRRSALFSRLILINKSHVSLTGLVSRMICRQIDYDESPEKLYLKTFTVEFLLTTQSVSDLIILIKELSVGLVAVLMGGAELSRWTNGLARGVPLELQSTYRGEFVQLAVMLLCDLLGSHEFVSKLQSSQRPGQQNSAEEDEAFELVVEKALEATLLLLTDGTNCKSYLRTNLFAQLISKVNELLPADRIVLLISGLLIRDKKAKEIDKNTQSRLQIQLLDLLNEQLDETSRLISLDTMTTILNPLSDIVKKAGKTRDELHIKSALKALHSLTTVGSRLGSHLRNASKSNAEGDFSDVTSRLSTVLETLFRANFQLSHKRPAGEKGNGFAPAALIAAAILATVMDIHAVPFIPQIVQLLLEQFSSLENINAVTNMTALSTVSSRFASYLGPHISDLILNVIKICSRESPDDGFDEIKMAARAFMRHMTHGVTYDIPLSALQKVFHEIDLSNAEAVFWYGELSAIFFSELPIKSSDLSAVLSDLQCFSTTALSYRAKLVRVDRKAVSDRAEGALVSAVMAFVPKLSEISFRPFLYSMFDWADKCTEEPHRMLTFFTLMVSMSATLKSLFTQFAAPYLTSKMVSLLDSANASKCPASDKLDVSYSLPLLMTILRTLTNTFTHDISSIYATAARSDSLVPAIVGHLSNTKYGKENFWSVVKEGLVPCVKALVDAAKHVNTYQGSTTVVQKINYQILLHARHEDSQVRLAVIMLLCESVVPALEEAYGDLLADSAAALHELLQDSDEEVERQAGVLLTLIERTTGQSMDKFF